MRPTERFSDRAAVSAALQRLFDAHAVDGRVAMHYRTRMHHGPLA